MVSLTQLCWRYHSLLLSHQYDVWLDCMFPIPSGYSSGMPLDLGLYHVMSAYVIGWVLNGQFICGWGGCKECDLAYNGNPWYFRKHTNICLHFVSFPNTEMAQVVEILFFWKTRNHLYSIFNAMVAVVLVMQRVNVSVAMVLLLIRKYPFAFEIIPQHSKNTVYFCGYKVSIMLERFTGTPNTDCICDWIVPSFLFYDTWIFPQHAWTCNWNMRRSNVGFLSAKKTLQIIFLL